MGSTEIYSLYAAAALVGLLKDGWDAEKAADKADYVARLMVARQQKWAAECGL